MNGAEGSRDGNLGAEPLVSIIIPVLNGERHIAACLASVLEQSYERLEVVVVDNASSDRTVEIVASFEDSRVRLVTNAGPQLGLHENWTRALKEGHGEFIKIVPHDDLLHVRCVATQIDLLRRYPTAVLASSRRRIVDDRDSVIVPSRGLGRLVGREGTRLIKGPAVARACVRAGTNLLGEPACVLIRHSALPDPPFDPRWSYALDIEFYLRCLQGRFAALDAQSLCDFRASPNQLSAVLGARQASEMRAFLRQMSRTYPDDVTRLDVVVGATRSQFIVWARRLLYLFMRVREAARARRNS